MEQMKDMEYQKQLLSEINILDFAVIDMALYLDTHPQDGEAMEYYNRFIKALVGKEKEFAKRFYPLMQVFCEGNQDWSWESHELPWEGGRR